MGRFLRQLHRIVSDEQLLRRGDSVVLAVSGGPDSMALLHGMVGLSQAHDWDLRLHVAHLNHQTRGADSDADAEFVAEAARQLGLGCSIETIDVPAAADAGPGGFEQTARELRYDMLARVAREHGCGVVATGHHADDNAETILGRIVRGTGPRGLAGIPIRRPLGPEAATPDGHAITLIRPLLRFRRRLIARMLEANGLAFRTDASNLDPEPTRNWLRHELIPQIAERGNPGAVGALLRLGELSGWVNVFVEDSARRTLGSLVVDRTDQALTLNAGALGKKRRILQAEVIRQAILSLGPTEAEVSMQHLKAVMRLAGDDAAGKQVHLPGHMLAERQGDRLLLSRRPSEDAADEASYRAGALDRGSLVVELPGRTELPLRRQGLTIEVEDNVPGRMEQFIANRGPGEELIDADRLRPPLVLRSWQAGDRFWPLGAPGTKKVGDFMTDHKISQLERSRVLLLCDQLGPVWVMPLRIDDRVKVNALTRRLAHLKLENGREQGSGIRH